MAATIKVRVYVRDISNVLLKYDQVQIWRSDTEDGVYTEITDVGTRINLLAGVSNYEYIDTTAPDNTYWYRTRYYNSSTLATSDFGSARQGTDVGLYVSIQDIRDEGISVTELSNERALILSLGWQDWFIHMTGNWFTPKQMTIDLDGNGSRVMWLDVPIITIDSLYINDDFTNAVDTDYYTVYNRLYPDDRKNPRIKLKRRQRSVFDTSRDLIFQTGDLNQRVVGSFGYVDEDGSVPFLVQRAIMTLIVLTAELKSDGDIDQLLVGRLVEEVTDRHRVKYSDIWDEIQAWKSTGITEVDMALEHYRRPAKIDMARTFIT